jgi:hypothetical protein
MLVVVVATGMSLLLWTWPTDAWRSAAGRGLRSTWPDRLRPAKSVHGSVAGCRSGLNPIIWPYDLNNMLVVMLSMNLTL